MVLIIHSKDAVTACVPDKQRNTAVLQTIHPVTPFYNDLSCWGDLPVHFRYTLAKWLESLK